MELLPVPGRDASFAIADRRVDRHITDTVDGIRRVAGSTERLRFDRRVVDQGFGCSV